MQYSIGVSCPLNCQNEYVETPIGLCLIFFGVSLLLALIFEQPTNGAPIDAVTSDFSIDLLFMQNNLFFYLNLINSNSKLF